MHKLTRRQFVATGGCAIASVGLGSALGLIGCVDSKETPTDSGSGFGLDDTPVRYQIRVSGDQVEVVEAATGRLLGPGDEILHLLTPPQDGDEIGLGIQLEFEPESAKPLAPQDWGQQFPGFFVYVGRIDTHPLSPCLDQPVKHTHLTLKRYSSTPDREAWAKFHLGAYRNPRRSKCLVLYDSQHPRICLKTCTPTREGLERLFRDALTALFAAIGIYVSATVIASAARALATALLALVLALA